ncbi:MAG: hypothetical protein Q8918_11565 [Bacteroidota bacterium]|nr:hypothetical protein [Bacteroidota bacterium]MDP4214310.1 hypothetical protein [Bacteroidota bacterium]MDP4250736.1 hypothetical protein [Bacteroidota bacterium]
MKKTFFSALAVICVQLGFSQTFMQGIGVVTYIQSAPGFTTSVTGGITYSPKVSFLETDNSSLSLGIPFSVGASGSYNYSSYGGENNSLAVMLDAPLILNFNVGAGSSKAAESRFGFFVGGGFGYHTSSYSADDIYGDSYSEKMAGFGPVGNLGIRIGVGQRSRNVEIRLSYMKTLDISASNIFGIGGVFNF